MKNYDATIKKDSEGYLVDIRLENGEIVYCGRVEDILKLIDILVRCETSFK